MDVFLKVTAGILLASIVTLALSKQNTDISLLLTILVCCMAFAAMIDYTRPVFQFLQRLKDVSQIDDELFRILIKSAGIGMLSQIACMICSDAGNKTLANVLQVVASVVILSLCIPLLDKVLVLIENVLGHI